MDERTCIKLHKYTMRHLTICKENIIIMDRLLFISACFPYFPTSRSSNISFQLNMVETEQGLFAGKPPTQITARRKPLNQHSAGPYCPITNDASNDSIKPSHQNNEEVTSSLYYQSIVVSLLRKRQEKELPELSQQHGESTLQSKRTSIKTSNIVV